MKEGRIIIRKLLLTEKGTHLTEKENQYLFRVDPSANKIEIKAAVKQLFNAEVASVNTLNVAGKTKRTAKGIGKRSNWKKAYVTLKEGSNVDFFEA